MVQSAVAGIIGPTDWITSMQARSVCDALEIPHVEVHSDVESRNDALTINLYPRAEILANAYLDVIKGLGWEEFLIVYDQNDQVVIYKQIFKEARDKGWKVHVYQFDPDKPFRDTFIEIKAAKKNNILLDVKHKILIEVLKHVSFLYTQFFFKHFPAFS